jgi:hypothetical protein
MTVLQQGDIMVKVGTNVPEFHYDRLGSLGLPILYKDNIHTYENNLTLRGNCNDDGTWYNNRHVCPDLYHIINRVV